MRVFLNDRKRLYMLCAPYCYDFASRNVNFKGAWLWKGVNCEHTHGETHLSSISTPPMTCIESFAAVNFRSAENQLTIDCIDKIYYS